MADEIDDTIYGSNGYEFEFPIYKKDDATGAKVPATGLAGLNAHVAADEGGATIHATLQVAIAERSAKPGYYFGRILGSNILANLFPANGVNYDGKYVWIVVTDSVGEVQGSHRVKAKAKRKI